MGAATKCSFGEALTGSKMSRDLPLPGAELLSDATLLAYAEQFIGFGDPSAPYWFLWTGPSYPKMPGNSYYAFDEDVDKWRRDEAERLGALVQRWSRHRYDTCRFEALRDPAAALITPTDQCVLARL
jgi:hypothetical protein